MLTKYLERGFPHPTAASASVILPTVVCSNKVANDIAREVLGAIWINNEVGCCQLGGDARLTYKTLVNAAGNPNIGAIVVVGLGCEGTQPSKVAESIKAFGKPVTCITIQGEGGTVECKAKGVSPIARAYAQDLSQQVPVDTLVSKQVPVDTLVSKLILAMECGGSDATSGLGLESGLWHRLRCPDPRRRRINAVGNDRIHRSPNMSWPNAA